MTVRNLEAMFRPKSVALIGAGKTPGTVGGVLAGNLLTCGFGGKIFLVNPKHHELVGCRCYPDIDSLPEVPELAVIATPAETVPPLIAGLGEAGTKAAIIITAGYGKTHGSEANLWKRSLQESGRPHLLRLLGPNCLGAMVPGHCLNASFGQLQPLTGNLAFVAQSGAVLTSVLDWATSREIGFSHFVSLGDMVDVDFGDMLDYLAAEVATRAILLYVESITNARKFMSAARAAARVKPVIVVKGGRFAEGAQAAASHTGSLAGTDAVYDAVFRRTGMLRVMDMEALFTAVETLALARKLNGNRLAILTNGGGMGVLATDTLAEKNGRLAQLSPETIAQLNTILPPTWSGANPVDIIGDADGERYAEAMAVLMTDKGLDGIFVMHCPTAVTSGTAAAKAVVETIQRSNGTYRRPMVLAGWLASDSAEEARRLFRRNRIPVYTTPEQGVRGFMQMVRYQQGQEILLETVSDRSPRFTSDKETAHRVISQALAEGRKWLNQPEVQKLLTAYAIPVVPSSNAATPEEAAQQAAAVDGPWAVKIVAPAVTHKSDVGGVLLNLDTPERVGEAAAGMLSRVSSQWPEVEVTGFTVQPMVLRPHGRELIVGAVEDDQFGPVLLFGHGGTAVEVIRDKAIGLPPLNMNLAHEMIRTTRVYRLLQGYRNIPAADIEAVALTLIKVSQLVCEIAEIKELDINPLLADEAGVIVLDARIRIAHSKGPATDRLAIRPYPQELEDVIVLPDATRLLLRPIRPEDERGFQDIVASLPPEDVRMRFLHPMRTLPHELAARLTQIDYDREMALVIEGVDNQGCRLLHGGVRISADPDNERAEFAILLRREMTGSGLGPLLMRRIIDYARGRGIGTLYGEVLSDNVRMLRLAAAFGFSTKPISGDPGLRLLELQL